MASIYKQRGRFIAQVNVRGVRRSKSFDKISDARQWAKRAEVELADAPRAATRRHTISDAIHAHLTNGRPAQRSKVSALTVINDLLGRRHLDEISSRVILEFAETRAAQPSQPGAATIGLDLTILRTAILHGAGYLDADPAPALIAIDAARRILTASGKVSRPTERNRRPTDRELDQLEQYLLASTRRAWLWDVIQFAICTGMRLSEICRITFDDLDVEAKTIVVRDRKDPRAKIGRHETIPLLAHWRVDPMAIIAAQPQRGPRIFPRDPASVSTAFTRACRACGIIDLRFHDLRHHAVSLLFEAGLSIAQVSAVSGHRDWQQLRRYTNLKPGDIHDAIRK